MKKLLLALTAALALTGCTNNLHVNNQTIQSYGLLNRDEKRSDRVCYELSIGNLLWGAVLVETIIGPIYFFGFDLYEPTRLKTSPTDDCSNRGSQL